MIKRLFICLFCFTLCACNASKPQVLTRYDFSSINLGFDTLISFSAYCVDEAQFEAYTSILSSEFTYYHQLFDKYNNYEGINNIKTINDQAGIAPVEVDQKLIDMLLLAKEYEQLSHGQFDITMGNVLNLWHKHREANNNTLPTIDELNQAYAFHGFDYLTIDDENNTVFISDPNVSLDVGGIAKGYAVEQCAKHLKVEGLKHALINAGGNVYFIGNKVDMPWSIGLQIPDLEIQRTDALISFYVEQDLSFVTSGDYQRFYQVDDKYYHHIIDPSTLMPASHARSVTVICEDSGLADVLSTTLFTMSYEDGSKLIEDVKTSKNIDIKAVWVFDDTTTCPKDVDFISKEQYKIVLSQGLEAMVKK